MQEALHSQEHSTNMSEEDYGEPHKLHLSDKYYLCSNIKSELEEHYPQVINLLELLYKYIEKQKRKLKLLKRKMKKSPKMVNSAVQTDNPELLQQAPESITEEITKAAEQAVQNSGFVFEETSGLYYDYNTGYYYNAELGLYYDGNTGVYMEYDSSSNSYKFHSKAEVFSKVPNEKIAKLKSKAKRKCHNQGKNKESKMKCLPGRPETNNEELEEGECSETESSEENSINSIDNEDSLDSDIGKQWPPCMRIIIEESTLPKLKIGSLYIVTYEGGSLGREGDHSILIPDINTSKHHLKFTFDKESGKFMATDLGSRNGTILNGKRMAVSKQESEAQEVAHGSRIQIGTTVLLCHIHNGNETCGLCEPGLIQSKEEKFSIPKDTKEMQHKKELKRLRKKFGICPQENINVNLASGYSDRAQARRETVGSQNQHEKTEVASVDEFIKPTNIGFKLLSKMGWSEGQALGKEGTGISEPIQPQVNKSSAGLGTNLNEIPHNENNGKKSKGKIWLKTQQRFNKLQSGTNIFEESD